MAAGQTPSNIPPGNRPNGTYQPSSQAGLYPPYSSKSHIVAGLLAIFLGALGVHKFYLGYFKEGFIMLAVTIIGSMFTFGLAASVMGVISLIEGFTYLLKPQQEFVRIYLVGRKEWF